MEVKLSDEEVLRIMIQFTSELLNHTGYGIGSATTNKKIRSIFTDLLNSDIAIYESLFNIIRKRQVFETSPPATSAPDSLTMGEINWLWAEINYRNLSIYELVTFLNNTKDQDLINEIKYGLNKVSIPELKEIEEILKREGFTVPVRPLDRTIQQPEGETGMIVLKDIEILSLLLSASQVAVTSHINAYLGAYREDIMKLYKSFTFIEIDNVERLLNIAKKRNILLEPPFVTSKHG